MVRTDQNCEAGPGIAPKGFGQGFVTSCWYFLALSRDVRPGALKRYQLLGQPVMVGRSSRGELFALRDACPHRAAPLSAGTLRTEADGAQSVECPYHGWRFGGDGRCVAIPFLADGQMFDPSRIKVASYAVAESQGMVFIWAPKDFRVAEAPDGPPPRFPGVVGGGPKLATSLVFEAHIDHAVVGLMDPAHGPFVHHQWWWRSRASIHEKAKVFEPREAGFAMTRHKPSSNSRAYALLGGQPETEITFRLPGMRWEHVNVGSRQLLALTCLTPLADAATRITQIVWSDHPVVTLLKPLISWGARRFLQQDCAMVDLQAPNLRDGAGLLWVDDADRQARWYHALKREWATSRAEGRPFQNPVEATTLRWKS